MMDPWYLVGGYADFVAATRRSRAELKQRTDQYQLGVHDGS